jgi:transcription antitermination factor NusG
LSESNVVMPSSSDYSNDSRLRWFAVRVRSRCERVVATLAQHKDGVEAYLPTYVSRRRWADRVKSIEFPLFPGYVFCRLDPRHRLPVLTIPGVVHFVGFGETPVPIDDEEIAALQSAGRLGLPTEPWPFLEVGERIQLVDGPLAGLEGIFIGDSRRQRLVVSITLLKRSVAIEIERHWAARTKGTARPLVTAQAERIPETKNVLARVSGTREFLDTALLQTTFPNVNTRNPEGCRIRE